MTQDIFPNARATAPPTPHKGRGALSNTASTRFTALQREAVDDGWPPSPAHAEAPGQARQAGQAEQAESPGDTDPPESRATVVGEDRGPGILTRNRSPDIPFDRSINPYKGCEHGCIYCFARPTHAYLDLSPGLDFETKLHAKPEAPAALRAALNKPGYVPDVVTLGANTDPYQPVERRLRITRGLLEVLAEARHPVCIVTKSPGVTRDLDILEPMARDGLVRVMVSITTLDRALARKLEPRAPTPMRRITALRALAEAEVPTGVLAAPMIPALNESELEAILAEAADAGAQSAGYVLLRLPHEVKDLFAEWLDVHYPERKDHILNRVREARGGKLNDAAWGTRFKGRGRHADLLAQRFDLACKRHGLNGQRWTLDTTLFRPPARDPRQMSLF